MKKAHPFVVSLASDLRPIVMAVNRALASQGARPVGKEELAEIDRILHETGGAQATPLTRCPRCGGYVDASDDQTCLNCGRPVGARRELDDVIEKIARGLLAHRHNEGVADDP